MRCSKSFFKLNSEYQNGQVFLKPRNVV